LFEEKKTGSEFTVPYAGYDEENRLKKVRKERI